MGTEANEGNEEGKTKNRALRYLLCSWVKMRGFLIGQLAGIFLIFIACCLTKNKNTYIQGLTPFIENATAHRFSPLTPAWARSTTDSFEVPLRFTRSYLWGWFFFITRYHGWGGCAHGIVASVCCRRIGCHT